MTNNRIIPVLLAVAVLVLLTALSGCGADSGILKGGASSAPARNTAAATTDASAGAGATTAPGSQADASQDQFAAAFQAVERNPLNETIQIALWLAATSADEPADPGTSGGSALRALADKYAAIVADKGVHYTEVADVWGMSLKTEYWVKDGMFKKWEQGLGKVTLFDGKHYIQYDTDEKKGTRFDGSYAAGELATLSKGTINGLAAAVYQQKEDQKVGNFDCSVFHLDIEMMGFKGITMYVDKQTGLLAKYQGGDPEDKKNSMAITVEQFEAGGFDNEVFTVPEDITLEDY